MISLCASKLLLPWLLAWNLSGHPDATILAAHADSFGVPVELMWAIARVETYHSIRNTEVSRAGALGRMQIMPRYWHHRCGNVYGRRNYQANVRCGALVLRIYYVETGSWLDAATRYCGTGPDALAYRRQVQFALGRLQWKRWGLS